MLFQFEDKKPVVSRDAFIADGAFLVGDIVIGERSSVWFNSVIRGDRGKIIIGNRSNIQDCTVIHSGADGVEIGNGVSIGHGSVIHGCRIKDNVLIGMNSTIMNGAEIGEASIVGAGALVPQGHKIPAHSIVIGVPCRQVRASTREDIQFIKDNSATYEDLTRRYLLSGKKN